METSEEEFTSDESWDANVEETSSKAGKDVELLNDDHPDRAPKKTLDLLTLTPRENNCVAKDVSDQDQIEEMKSGIDMEEEIDNDIIEPDDHPDRAPKKSLDLLTLTPRENNCVAKDVSDQDQIEEMKSGIDMEEEIDNDIIEPCNIAAPLNPIQETDNWIIIEEINANDMGENAKIQICEKNTDDGFVIEKRVISHQECVQDVEFYEQDVDNIDQPKISDHPMKTVANKTKNEIYKKIWDPKSSSRRRRRIQPAQKEDKKAKNLKAGINVIDLEKLENTSEEKQIRKVQTYKNKGKANDNITVQPNQRLYQRIPPREEEVKISPPTKLSVFDFHDEEEEKRELELKEKMKKLEDIKERTCRICKEVFSDPLDVLRHKRKFHTSPKILLSREELKPYLLLENQNACPICFKVISTHVTRAPYINHVMIHCKQPSFKCKICGTTFKRKHALSVHEKRHIVTPETAK